MSVSAKQNNMENENRIKKKHHNNKNENNKQQQPYELGFKALINQIRI